MNDDEIWINLHLLTLLFLKLQTYLSNWNFCIGARVMLTVNISISDRLTDRSIGTVIHLDMRLKLLCSTICVKFDEAGNAIKK